MMDECLVIPKGLRQEMLRALHQFHPSGESMWLEARGKIFWPGLKNEIMNHYLRCPVCTEVSRMRYEPPPMLINEDLAKVLQPMDELRVDWGSVGQCHFHIVCDLATSYLWVKEYQHMTTSNSTSHLNEIMGVFGRALSVGGDGGPSYRGEWEDELGAMGVFVEHGAIHHPESQGLAEKKVGMFKESLARNPARPGLQVQELVNAMNRRQGFPPGVGSPAGRMFDREIRAILPSLPTAQVPAAVLRDKLAASRDKAQGRRKNARAIHFEEGESALLWDHREHKYKIPVSIVAPNIGMDGAARSFWIEDEGGRQRLVHVSWLVKMPVEPTPTPTATSTPHSA